ncbi:glucose-6-phosphate dehydrogenase assembly protein OpcA [soil metagenome]
MVMSLESVERELARLRMNDDGTLGLRASVLNLIVMVGEESAEEVARGVSELANRHPSRSIILVSDADGESSLDIRLSAFCSLRGGSGDNVCSEQITVYAGGPPALHLESVAGPLLVPDLPTFLFYPEGFPDSDDGVIRLADRVILDSSASPGCERSFRKISALVESPDTPAVGDIQWTALSPWRSLAGELFSSPERSGDLRNIREVEVMHTAGGESRAMLFAGWLASSLGWMPKKNRPSDSENEVSEGGVSEKGLSEKGLSERGVFESGIYESEVSGRGVSGRGFVFDGLSGEMVFRTFPSADDVDLSRITLRAGDLSFVISRHKELTEAHISVERGDETLSHRAVRIGRFDMGTMLDEELKFKGRDPVYESSLEKVMEMMNI